MEYVKLKSDRDVSTTFKTEMSPEAIEALKNSGDAIQILDLKVYQLLEFLATSVVDHNADGATMFIKGIGGDNGDFEFQISCEKVEDKVNDPSILDSIKRWFR